MQPPAPGDAVTPNLTCAHGHRAYSPDPHLWIGHDCGHGEQRTKEGLLYVRGRCRETLFLVGETQPELRGPQAVVTNR